MINNDLSNLCVKLIHHLPGRQEKKVVPGTWQYTIGLLLLRPTQGVVEQFDMEIILTALEAMELPQEDVEKVKYVSMTKSVITNVINNWWTPSVWSTQNDLIINQYAAA